MKFGVIGEPCIDYIHLPDGQAGKSGKEPIKRLGGILYSLTSLAAISIEGHDVYPIMNLGEDEYEHITTFLSKFDNIKMDYVNKVKHNVRVVQLYYKPHDIEYENSLPGYGLEQNIHKTYDREESSTEPIEPVEYVNIKKAFGKLDALLINMISGIDITLETLKKIREDFSGYIHLDVHNIVMKTCTDGQRIQGPVNEWQDWCINCDTLQMNESEINIISFEKLKEYDIAFNVLAENKGKGPKALVITRGTDGASLFQKKEKNILGEKFGDIDREDLSAIENTNFRDSTGCGDVFGAGFFYKNSIHEQSNFAIAANFANKLASAKTELTGVEEMVDLRFKM
jgi:hypothetical protein